MDWIQAVTIGFLGSFHCIGMCGPIALALPLKEQSMGTRIFSALLYNSGRIFTYFLLGLIFGSLGTGLELWGFQRWISIVLGIIMILSVTFPYLFRAVNLESRIDKGLSAFKQLFANFFGYRSFGSAFIIGMLNGFLPCGLVYLAIAGAIVSASPLNGGFYMLLFGIGTIPALFAVTLIGNIFGMKFRNTMKKIIPVFIIIIGLLFILRGLNLGIPYLSPEMHIHEIHPACCH